jgi:arginine decarboxylase-like protein
MKKPVNPKAPSNNALWTKKDDAMLKEMASNKSTTAQIAIALGRTKASVWGRKSMLGIKARLSSSKGQNVFAPTTLSTKKRSASATPVTKVVKTVREAKVVEQANISMDFATLSRLAKESGAKIVITFE